MGVTRRALLWGSNSAWLRRRVEGHPFLRARVSRLIAEETAGATLAARALQTDGIAAVLTRLGGPVSERRHAEQATGEYLALLETVARLGLDAQISVKLTQLGLNVSDALCDANLRRLVRRAAELRNSVGIDMEDAASVDATIEAYRRARVVSPCVWLCLQAYLRRTAADVASLLPLAPAIRLVKGGFTGTGEGAFGHEREVRASYLSLAATLLQEQRRGTGTRAAFATHDRPLIEQLQKIAVREGLPADAVEFLMLYGVRTPEQLQLAREGYRVRALVSFGPDWFPWYMRRLASKPANLLLVLRSVVGNQSATTTSTFCGSR
jgi:proline dehydrogenase